MAQAVWGCLGIVILLICSGLVSASEVAFFSLTVNDFEKLDQENTSSSKRILSLKERPRRLLATILISNNFINIGIVILSAFVLRIFFPDATFQGWAASLTEKARFLGNINLAVILQYAITVVGVTFMLVLFGETAPKVYARQNNVRLARMMAGPMLMLMRVFGPISNLLVNWTKVLEGRLALKTGGGALSSREDLDEAIELTVSNEKDAGQEADLLKRIVKFGDMAVTQIMRSRLDVVAVNVSIDYKELLEVVRESGYSRIPVYEEDFDNVKGILYVKDLLGHLNENEDFRWQDLIRSNILFVPEAKKIDALLKDFQRQHLHMAIVVDEYGGGSGLVTLEDIMEEIIGDIKDEFDDEPELIYQQIDERNYVFEGKTLLNDVCRVLNIKTTYFDDVKGEADSLAGLVLEMEGELPQQGSDVSIKAYNFKILSVDERRIISIQVTLPESPPDEENE